MYGSEVGREGIPLLPSSSGSVYSTLSSSSSKPYLIIANCPITCGSSYADTRKTYSPGVCNLNAKFNLSPTDNVNA